MYWKESHKQGEFSRFEKAIIEFDEVLSCWAVGGTVDYVMKVLVKDVLEYQDFIKKILKADIGLNRYFSYAVLNTIKDTNQIPESLIKKSTIAK